MIKGKRILIIGGAGFIGINTARHFIKKSARVTILDNLSRKGSGENLKALERDYPGKFELVQADIVTERDTLDKCVGEADVVLHLAAQVAVTTSVENPRNDFEINAVGSFNVAEAVRRSSGRPILIYSSTNKVYGSLPHRSVSEQGNRYKFKDAVLGKYGVSEKEQLDFHSPYGCSKGVADQYVLDYSRVYGLKSVVFRQSCIYGEHQFGVEDQGWVAWFGIAALSGTPIKLYGTGKQVRDILFADDLARLYEAAIEKIDKVNGEAFNIGGGPANTLSLLELLEKLEKKLGKKISYSFSATRVGDQPIFVADIRKIKKKLGWQPRVGVNAGLRKMMRWIEKNEKLIRRALLKESENIAVGPVLVERESA